LTSKYIHQTLSVGCYYTLPPLFGFLWMVVML